MNNENSLRTLEEQVDEALEKSTLYSTQEGEEYDNQRQHKIDELKQMKSEMLEQAQNLDQTPKVKPQISDEDYQMALKLYEEEQKQISQDNNSNTLEKAPQKKLVKEQKNKFNSNGFAEGFIFTLLIGFASGAVFTIAYILLKAGKYSFIM